MVLSRLMGPSLSLFLSWRRPMRYLSNKPKRCRPCSARRHLWKLASSSASFDPNSKRVEDSEQVRIKLTAKFRVAMKQRPKYNYIALMLVTKSAIALRIAHSSAMHAMECYGVSLMLQRTIATRIWHSFALCGN